MKIEICPKDCLNRIVDIYELTFIELMNREYIKYNLNCFLNNEKSICIIVSNDNKDLGFVLGNVYYYGNERYAKIDEICVANGEQGKGIGKILIHEFEKKALESKISCVYFEQYKDEKLDRFYSNNGYKLAEDKEFRYKEF